MNYLTSRVEVARATDASGGYNLIIDVRVVRFRLTNHPRTHLFNWAHCRLSHGVAVYIQLPRNGAYASPPPHRVQAHDLRHQVRGRRHDDAPATGRAARSPGVALAAVGRRSAGRPSRGRVDGWRRARHRGGGQIAAGTLGCPCSQWSEPQPSNRLGDRMTDPKSQAASTTSSSPRSLTSAWKSPLSASRPDSRSPPMTVK